MKLSIIAFSFYATSLIWLPINLTGCETIKDIGQVIADTYNDCEKVDGGGKICEIIGEDGNPQKVEYDKEGNEIKKK